MPRLRHRLPVLAALLTLAVLANEAQAGPRQQARPPAPVAQPDPSPGAEAEPAPLGRRSPAPIPASEPGERDATTSRPGPARAKPRAAPTGPAPAKSGRAGEPAPTASGRAGVPASEPPKAATAQTPEAATEAPKATAGSKSATGVRTKSTGVPTKSAAEPPKSATGVATKSTGIPTKSAAEPTKSAAAEPTKSAAEPTKSAASTPSKSAKRPRKPAGGPISAPDPKDSPQLAEAPRPRSTARPLRPRREPLLARHPAASCSLDPLEAIALHQHGRARDSLREFYWSDMARFFETSVDGAEPAPTQAVDPAFLSTDVVLRDLPAAVRKPLAAVAAARVVDRLGEREFNKVSKLLASLGPAEVAGLLRADSPTLRAYVWTWLATTRTGGCHLGHLDLDFLEAAVADRSVAVEHGDDLVYRSLGDYALAARARLANLDPARFDAFLERLTTAAEVDPLVRAAAHGVLLRRARWDLQVRGLADASPAVRAATAAAAIEMNRDKVEPALVEHAASDPADLVTELVVGALLGVYDPHSHGRPQLRGPLAGTRDDRLAAAVARWRGRGDPLEPLPAPTRPLRFSAAPTVVPDLPARAAIAAGHVPKDMLEQTPTPVREDMPARTASAVPEDMSARTAAETRAPLARTPQPEPRARPASDPRDAGPPLPGVLDDPDDHPPALP